MNNETLPAVTEVTLPSSNLTEQNRVLLEDIAALKRERAAAEAIAESNLKDARIKSFIADARKPAAQQCSNSRQYDITRAQLIAQSGGLAIYMSRPADERCAALGITNSASVKDAELRKYFGSSSNSLSSTQLAKSSPETYGRLKQIAIERGIY